MAINYNGFPVTYQPLYPQPQYSYQPQPQPQQAQNNSIIWVSGEAGAKAYLVAPNTTVQLWDSESQSIYLKSADASGMPSMKILDYTIRDQAPVPSPMSNAETPEYATKADVLALRREIGNIRTKIDGMSKGEPADE